VVVTKNATLGATPPFLVKTHHDLRDGVYRRPSPDALDDLSVGARRPGTHFDPVDLVRGNRTRAPRDSDINLAGRTDAIELDLGERLA